MIRYNLIKIDYYGNSLRNRGQHDFSYRNDQYNMNGKFTDIILLVIVAINTG